MDKHLLFCSRKELLLMTKNDLFIRGESKFFTPIIGTSDIPPKDVKARIDWSNTTKRLNTFFFGSEVLKLIVIKYHEILQVKPTNKNWLLLKKEYKQTKKEKYLISVKKPTSGYSETALLSVAGRVSQLTGVSKKNDLIYDYPLIVRKTYWNAVFSVMDNFIRLQKTGKLPQKFSKLRPFVTGHHGRALSNYPPFEKHPGIRTVILHHDHLVFLDEENVKPINWNDNMFNLDKEEKLYWNVKKHNLHDFVSQLNNIPELLEIGCRLKTRNVRPIGYETIIDYKRKPVSKLVKFLQQHFLAYSKTVNKSDMFNNSAPIQPTFTFYLIPEASNELRLIFSPNIIASGNRIAGGPERAGLLIQRRPDIKTTITEKEKRRFGKLLVSY